MQRVRLCHVLHDSSTTSMKSVGSVHDSSTTPMKSVGSVVCTGD